MHAHGQLNAMRLQMSIMLHQTNRVVQHRTVYHRMVRAAPNGMEPRAAPPGTPRSVAPLQTHGLYHWLALPGVRTPRAISQTMHENEIPCIHGLGPVKLPSLLHKACFHSCTCSHSSHHTCNPACILELHTMQYACCTVCSASFAAPLGSLELFGRPNDDTRKYSTAMCRLR